MIPGYFDGLETLAPIKHEIGGALNAQIRDQAAEEFSGKFIKDNSRVTVAEVVLECGGNDGLQEAVVNLMWHNKTSLCVVEIYAYDLKIPPQTLLSYYSARKLFIRSGNERISLSDYLLSLGVTVYGSKRSMVFVNQEIKENELLNILTNEEKPMGKITGTHFKNIINNNLAQYDTARVYASETTFVEIVKNPLASVKDRLHYQAIEIFFIEMLLLQDAAVSKMNSVVKEKVEYERENPYSKQSREVIYRLMSEMAHAYNYADYTQFYFPTVRVSAERVAEAFGINFIANKFEQNKQLLEQMLESNKKKLIEKENSLKNGLLFIITFLTGISIIAVIMGDILNDILLGYSIAFGVMTVGIILYFFIKILVKKSLRKRTSIR